MVQMQVAFGLSLLLLIAIFAGFATSQHPIPSRELINRRNNQLKNSHSDVAIRCDVRHNPCRPSLGLVCDYRQSRCVCADGFIQLNNGKCLKKKSVNEKCTATVQCQTANSACLARNRLGGAADWTCQCLEGFWYDEEADGCQPKQSVGGRCFDDVGRCRAGLVCTASSATATPPSVNQSTCQCPPDRWFNETLGHCQRLNETRCPDGLQLNQISKKCDPIITITGSAGRGESSKTSATQEVGQASVRSSKLLRSVSSSSVFLNNENNETDQKVLEIILEVSFLIVCLLAYQVCSKACCPNDNDDDIDVKSDEESIIGNPGSGGGSHLTRSPFLRGHRKTRRVFCKSSRSSSAGSTQKLVSSPVIATSYNGTNAASKLKDVIVKFEDSKTSCYNCKIYQQVYSPTARCKMCRETLADDENDSNCGSCEKKSQLLPLPTYHHKPIRRSEEVGVPPHLRAPYVNNQPFWLK